MIDDNYVWALGIVLFLIGFFCAYLIFHVVYGFTYTEQLKKEDAVMPLCQNMNQMYIEALNETCFNQYGGPVD